MHTLDYIKYKQKIRQAVAESVVLLKNDNDTLPIKKQERVAIFGRAQIDTYYCGTGSGGMVNIPYLVSIAKGIKAKRQIDENLYDMYVDFVQQNPFDKGDGWAMEPFSQKELLLTDEIVKNASKNSDIAIFTIGRSAGEDKDVLPEGGSYYLSDTEKHNLLLVHNHFKKVAVLFNVGGIMDTSFVEATGVSSILYAWHGGVESGNGYADVLCGDVNASGCLPNTIARNLQDYPSNKNFGGDIENIYAEDIYVGYRYFETFAKDKVLYPFGYGLSYSRFKIKNCNFITQNSNYVFNFDIENIGDFSGKKTAQLYVQAPVQKLGKPKLCLVGFAKTGELKQNQAEKVQIEVSKKDMASFDDEISAFVLEKGEYTFYIGFNVRDLQNIAKVTINNDEIIQKCNEALLPIKPFEKMNASIKNGEYVLNYTNAITRNYDTILRIKTENDVQCEKTNFGYTFDDVINKKITAEELASDLSDIELIQMSRGEGMCSPKVTPGTAGCFGGVSEQLQNVRKMPIACCADGPSGIRMDCGTMAFSVPNATALASSFNTTLISELFEYLSIEMIHHKIDTLLGPGMNIHRNPLCGRNFEYYSEDPFLTGKMAVAQIKTMNKFNITGTVKHFVANNQEKARKTVDAVVSARALREIYLKGFEMAVKEGNAYSLMTAYNPVNGTQAASNYDLNTTVLRKDWGFNGVVMTDWWATMNKESGISSETHTADMIASQNDVYMVCASSQDNTNGDDSEKELATGNLTRYPLVRNAVNIINALLRFNCSMPLQKVELKNTPINELENIVDLGTFEIGDFAQVGCENIITTKNTTNKMVLNLESLGKHLIEFDLYANAVELAQIPLTVKANGSLIKTITLKGGTKGVYTCEINMFATINTYVELYFGESGMQVNSINIKRIGV